MTQDIQAILIRAVGSGAWAFITEWMKNKGIYMEGSYDQGDGNFAGILHTPLADITIEGQVVPRIEGSATPE